MKLKLAGLALFSVASAFASQTPNFHPVVKDHGGNMVLKTQQGASFYCFIRFSHLPSAREFALFATAQGARGTRETAYPKVDVTDYTNHPETYREMGDMAAEGFNPVYHRDGKK